MVEAHGRLLSTRAQVTVGAAANGAACWETDRWEGTGNRSGEVPDVSIICQRGTMCIRWPHCRKGIDQLHVHNSNAVN